MGSQYRVCEPIVIFIVKGGADMPEMRVHNSGGIVFVPTKEELEIRKLKDELRQEIHEVRQVKEELLSLMTRQRGDINNA